jgi:hypothetical protein
VVALRSSQLKAEASVAEAQEIAQAAQAKLNDASRQLMELSSEMDMERSRTTALAAQLEATKEAEKVRGGLGGR